ncbi:hypothetical protein D3C78_1874070 [compost metagenome]
MRSATWHSGRYDNSRSDSVRLNNWVPWVAAKPRLAKLCITPLGRPVVPEV